MQTVVRPDKDDRDLVNVHAEYFVAACHGSDRQWPAFHFAIQGSVPGYVLFAVENVALDQ